MAERENRIRERLKKDYDYVRTLGYEVFGVFLQGSQNYQLDYEGSDIDTKCIVLPSAEDVILNKPPVSTTLILEDNSHIDLKDIRLMWQCFRKQNINYLEILFTEFFYIPYDYYLDWMDMTARREDIAHMDNYLAINCIVGMILEKNAALCHPYPTLKDKIDKYGYDNKQLHHILRCQEFLDRYIAGVSYADCLISQNPKYLTEIKATYKFDLNTAKALAKDTVEYAKFVKKSYLENHEHVTNTKMSEEIDSIMVSILSRYWRDMC